MRRVVTAGLLLALLAACGGQGHIESSAPQSTSSRSPYQHGAESSGPRQREAGVVADANPFGCAQGGDSCTLTLPRLRHLRRPYGSEYGIERLLAWNELAMFGQGDGLCGAPDCYDLATIKYIGAKGQLTFSETSGALTHTWPPSFGTGDCSQVGYGINSWEPGDDQQATNKAIWARPFASIATVSMGAGNWGLVNHSDKKDCFLKIEGPWIAMEEYV